MKCGFKSHLSATFSLEKVVTGLGVHMRNHVVVLGTQTLTHGKKEGLRDTCRLHARLQMYDVIYALTVQSSNNAWYLLFFQAAVTKLFSDSISYMRSLVSCKHLCIVPRGGGCLEHIHSVKILHWKPIFQTLLSTCEGLGTALLGYKEFSDFSF